MNEEENFQNQNINESLEETPTPKEGKRMNKTPWILVAVAMIAVFLALGRGFSQNTSPYTVDTANPRLVPATSGWEGATFSPTPYLEVRYAYDPSSDSDNLWLGSNLTVTSFQQAPLFSMTQKSVCTIGFNDEALTEGVLIGEIAYMLGACMVGTNQHLDSSQPNMNHFFGGGSQQSVNLGEYAAAYSEAYLAKCEARYEPLHWGGIKDEACELPDPVALAAVLWAD